MSGSAAVALLRAGRIDDLPALLQLEATFPGDRLSPRQLRYHLRRPPRLLVAEDARGIAGYSLLLRRAGERRARLYSLVVAADRRGAGIGRALLEAAERAAAAAGADGMRLEVRADNVAAIALYRRAGYIETGHRRGYYDDGEAAVCMARDFAAP